MDDAHLDDALFKLRIHVLPPTVSYTLIEYHPTVQNTIPNLLFFLIY
jgi:hypothetical protein